MALVKQWLAKPDGGVGWAVLLVAVFNFTPAQFSTEYLGSAEAWMRLLKDVPVLLLIVALIAPTARRRAFPDRVVNLGRLQQYRILRSFGRHATLGDVVIGLAFTLVLLALAIVIITLWMGAELPGTLVSARYYVVYPVVALLLASRGPYATRQLAAGIVVLAILQTVLAIADYAGFFGLTYYAGQVEFAGYVFPRAIGTLGNPNNLALFLGFASLILIGTGSTRSRRGKVLLGVISLGIVLTGSKTGLFAVALAWTTLFWTARDRHRPWPRLLVLGGILAASMALGALMTMNRLGAEPTLAGALGTRGETAQNALDQWLESPRTVLFGHGFAVLASVGPDSGIQETTTDTMVLALAVEGGVLAIVAFVLLVLLGIRMILLCPRDNPLRGVAIAFAVVMLVYTFVSVSARLFPGALFFWVLVGLCGSAARYGGTVRAATVCPVRPRARRDRRQRIVLRLVRPHLGLFLLMIAVFAVFPGRQRPRPEAIFTPTAVRELVHQSEPDGVLLESRPVYGIAGLRNVSASYVLSARREHLFIVVFDSSDATVQLTGQETASAGSQLAVIRNVVALYGDGNGNSSRLARLRTGLQGLAERRG